MTKGQRTHFQRNILIFIWSILQSVIFFITLLLRYVPDIDHMEPISIFFVTVFAWTLFYSVDGLIVVAVLKVLKRKNLTSPGNPTLFVPVKHCRLW
ncbi:hypothetical protein AB6A40_011426 [Gnathostoma spinigerum]|uniref:7TM GPCR serpentine receptor class x (Srx) domain-containing protein n=1 Tax=Gnathostoma spinigerum TaxID=75299 RepID=A0ABD6EZV4_9BILA